MQAPRYWRLRKTLYHLQATRNSKGEASLIARKQLVTTESQKLAENETIEQPQPVTVAA